MFLFNRAANKAEDKEKPKKLDEEAVPLSVVEFLDVIEEPLKDLYLPEARGKTIYASLLGTAANLTPAENIKVLAICKGLRCRIFSIIAQWTFFQAFVSSRNI